MQMDSAIAPQTGYRGPVASSAAGITYRQLDYWARTGLAEPTVRDASGSGSNRLYSSEDILLLAAISRLLDAGVALPQIRTMAENLRGKNLDELTPIILASDGVAVHECSTADEVYSLVRNGRGVVSIAVGRVWDDLAPVLAKASSEQCTAPPRLTVVG